MVAAGCACADIDRSATSDEAAGALAEKSPRADLVSCPATPVHLKVLYWLKERQAEDGSWGEGDGKVASTALATAAFLSACETPASSDRFVLSGAQGQHPVAKACDWLVRFVNAAEAQGDSRRSSSIDMPLIALALAEAYGASRNQNLKRPAILCLRKVVDACSAVGEDAKDKDTLDLAMWSSLALRAAKSARLEVYRRDQVLTRLEAILEKADYDSDGYYGGLQRLRYANVKDHRNWVDWIKEHQRAFLESFVDAGRTAGGVGIGYCRFPPSSAKSTGFGAVADSALWVMGLQIAAERTLPLLPDNGKTNEIGNVEVPVHIDL